MKTIALLDLDPDHFHSAKFLELFRGPLAGRGWLVDRIHALAADAGRTWAAQNQVQFAVSLEDLKGCQAAMVLAPRNPECHLELATIAFELGVPVYVDKPLAENLGSAAEIFRRADAKGVPVFSSSALRYAPGLARGIAERGGAGAIEHIRAWGGSGSLAEYAIHAVEMVVSVLGTDAIKISILPAGRQTVIHVDFAGGRTGTVFFHPHSDTHYQVMLSTAKETSHVLCAGPEMFERLAGAILDFFETGRPAVAREQSLLVRRILDQAEGVPARPAAGHVKPAERRGS